METRIVSSRIAFVYPQIDVRGKYRHILSSLDARTMVSQIVAVDAVEERPVRGLQGFFELFPEVCQFLEKGLLTIITTVSLVGPVVRIGHFIGSDDLKRDLMVAGEVKRKPVFPAGQGGAIG
jgi:hypothetical protein